MGLFTRSTPPAFGAAVAAAGGAPQGADGRLPVSTLSIGTDRALRVPTISRARDLLVSMIASLDLRNYSLRFDTVTGRHVREYSPGPVWYRRPDPRVSRQFIMSNTAGDLFLHGRAFWYVTSRYQTGYPAAFQWLPHDLISTPDQAGPVFHAPADTITYQGEDLDPRHVVQFLSPIAGVCYQGADAIEIAIRLGNAARRFALNEIPAGYLQQTGGEPMDADELADLAASWSESRRANAIGALNEYVKWVEFAGNPDKMQLTEGRQYSALELARAANVPPYLVGVATGGMTYSNAQQARQDLYLFGAAPYVGCIAETLSSNAILPNGSYTELDVEGWLAELSAMSDADRPTKVT